MRSFPLLLILVGSRKGPAGGGREGESAGGGETARETPLLEAVEDSKSLKEVGGIVWFES